MAPYEQKDLWPHVMGRPAFDSDGLLSGGVLIHSDVTSERALARDLAATALAHTRLLGELSQRNTPRRRLPHPLVEQLLEHGRRVSVDSLTPREMEVLRLMVRGHTNREIGAALHLSTGTAGNRITGTAGNRIGRLLDKLGATDRTHAAALAVTRTLLETE